MLDDVVAAVSGVLSDYVLVAVLLAVSVYFTVLTGGVQFRMIGEMVKLLLHSGKKDERNIPGREPQHGHISAFQAFALSIAMAVATPARLPVPTRDAIESANA